MENSRLSTLCVCALVVLLLTAACPSRLAFAATITVNTTDDEFGAGVGCSLREAIQAANTDAAFGGCPAGSGDDVISFAASVNGTPMVVGAGSTISGGLRLVGNGPSQTIISGGDAVRPLMVNAGVSVELSALRVTDGAAPGANGGAVQSAGILTLIDSEVTDSAAESGAGIYSTGVLTLRRTTISGNVASTGGGVRVTGGTVTITDSRFTANQALEGGGVFINSGATTVTGSTFRNNSAPGTLSATSTSGGAMFLTGANVTISDSLFEGNQTTQVAFSGRSGGGAIFSDGTLAITGSVLRGNLAGSGPFGTSSGGALAASGATTITDSTISGNYARNGGGISAGGLMTITRSTVSQNGAGTGAFGVATSGGGILSFGTLTITNSSVSGNHIGEGVGAGIAAVSPTISFSTLTGNTITTIASNPGPLGGNLRVSGTARLRGVIFSQGTPHSNCAGAVLSLGANVADDASCFPNGNGDAVVADLKLGPLADNGGQTMTHALLDGSPATDFVSGACDVATDQRGAARPIDGNGDGSATCDSGAFERAQGVPSMLFPNPVASGQKPDDDDKRKKETEEQRRQRERTNRGGKDDVFTEGNVIEVHQDELPPYVLLANRDGLVKVVLLCGDQCPAIRVGDYLEADGEKQHEQLFEAAEVTVRQPVR